MACIANTTTTTGTGFSVPAVPMKKSWAQMVKGAECAKKPADVAAPGAPSVKAAAAPKADERSECTETKVDDLKADDRKPLVPAIKGTMLCKCKGQVLQMMGHYGWIAPLERIDHSVGLSKNEGHAYVNSKDIEGGIMLGPGDLVSFYLYVDAQGLGAEAVCLTSRAVSSGYRPFGSFSFSAAAAEFVPTTSTGMPSMSADAAEFVPAIGGFSGMSPNAPEFVPAVSVPEALQPTPTEPHSEVEVADSIRAGAVGFGAASTSVLEINAAYFSESGSEDDGVEAGDEAFSSIAGDDEQSGSDGDEEEESGELAGFEEPCSPTGEYEGDVEVDAELDVVVMCAPLKARRYGAPMSDGSTSAGGESDSEDELLAVSAPLCQPRVPPGLSVLAAQ
mmetsp:Transcript_112904/g.299957  ORF Transcript_112904/g.299957 Transcript_112904/m.299957 type:complete len:391 (-) Transcript_112904:35-1207(-)|eukprot:CAMPEP_0171243130 /NCGR_PEP_ID=MMETSP0790-20130122/46113_1 /TAXON_ID=2925 /ORGANISM="Alexandrium catenella, Strain OF101" /LENGTH=390 /DNA_ID=CAMNT_0011710083 /DNA_START=96 /DNA_END=1268 /DNA_ORIENTATION=+